LIPVSPVLSAPRSTRRDGLHSQVPVGIDQGLKHDSSIVCDELVSLPKSVLTDYVGSLSSEKLLELDRALAFALDLTAPLVH
jgi:mRNA interferase MazF